MSSVTQEGWKIEQEEGKDSHQEELEVICSQHESVCLGEPVSVSLEIKGGTELF